MAKYLPYRKEKAALKEKDYTYDKLNKKFLENENNLIKKANEENKNKNKRITLEEIHDFREQIDAKKEELKNKKEIKENKEKNEIPTIKYDSNYNQKIDEELRNVIKDQKMKKEKANGFYQMKKKYAEKKIHQPGINETKKKERVDKIVKLEQPKLFQIKYTLKKQERIQSPDKKKLNWLYKLKKINDLKILNLSAEMENPKAYIKKPKMLRISSSFSKNKTKENSNTEKNKEELDNQIKKKNKNKIILPKTDNIIQDMTQMKEKAEILEKKAQMGEELLRVNGGIANNPKLGKKMSDLYVKSIEAKLKILNQVYDNEE